MISNKFSHRRHVPKRPPICNPPLKKIEQIPIPEWPPTKMRVKGYITYYDETHRLDEKIVDIAIYGFEWKYWCVMEDIEVFYTIRTDEPTLTLDSFYSYFDYDEIEFRAEPRPINPAIPIYEEYPPWIQTMGPPATGHLTIMSAET